MYVYASLVVFGGKALRFPLSLSLSLVEMSLPHSVMHPSLSLPLACLVNVFLGSEE